jgi:hypothetical protein
LICGRRGHGIGIDCEAWNQGELPWFQRNETSALVSIELEHLRYAEAAKRCGSFCNAADLLAQAV